jgi:hypothetical protein
MPCQLALFSRLHHPKPVKQHGCHIDLLELFTLTTDSGTKPSAGGNDQYLAKETAGTPG